MPGLAKLQHDCGAQNYLLREGLYLLSHLANVQHTAHVAYLTVLLICAILTHIIIFILFIMMELGLSLV